MKEENTHKQDEATICQGGPHSTTSLIRQNTLQKKFEYFLHSSASFLFVRFFFFKKPLFSSLSNLIQRLRLTVITGIWYLLVKLCLQEYCQCLLSWHLMSCLRGYLKILMWTGQLTNNCKTVKILMPLEFLVVTSILKKETPRSPAITWDWFAYWLD